MSRKTHVNSLTPTKPIPHTRAKDPAVVQLDRAGAALHILRPIESDMSGHWGAVLGHEGMCVRVIRFAHVVCGDVFHKLNASLHKSIGNANRLHFFAITTNKITAGRFPFVAISTWSRLLPWHATV